MNRKALFVFLLTAALYTGVLLIDVSFLTGCAPRDAVPQATAVVVSAAQIRMMLPEQRDEFGRDIRTLFLGDTAYAQVNSAWLHSFYTDFQSEIFRQGVVKWDDRFDCNHFASYYVALAQTKFYLANFQSSTPAKTLAIGVYWYVRDGKSGGGHAIVFACTERGIVFIEPQTGQEVTLSAKERASSFLKAF